MPKKFIAVLVLCTLLAGCGIVSVLSAIANWAPVGQAAFNGVASIALPASAANLQADSALVVSGLQDLATDAKVAEAAGTGQTGVNKVIADLSALSAALPKLESDAAPVLPAKDAAYLNDGLAVVLTVLTAYEAELGAAKPATVAFSSPMLGGNFIVESNRDGLFLARYIDGSVYGKISFDGTDPLEFATDGAAATANPVAAKKAPRIGQFKKQYNAICRAHGHNQAQLKLSLLEKLGVK